MTYIALLREAILALLPAAVACRLLFYLIQILHDPDEKPRIIKRIKNLLLYFLFALGIFELVGTVWFSF